MPSDIIMLMGGGIDSTALVHFFLSQGHKVRGLHYDYGQPGAEGEKRAVKAVGEYYGLQIEFRSLMIPMRREGFEFKCRNALLVLSAAAMARPSISGIGLAVHTGTGYYDCSMAFCRHLQRILDGYFRGCLQLKAPFVDLTKQEIVRYCIANRVPTELTFSCEVGPVLPCNSCPSCREREILDANEPNV